MRFPIDGQVTKQFSDFAKNRSFGKSFFLGIFFRQHTVIGFFPTVRGHNVGACFPPAPCRIKTSSGWIRS